MVKILLGDCRDILKTLPDESVDCCITSPLYWGLRDYGVDGQLGLEKTPEEYVAKLVDIFREVRKVLKKEGMCWLNLGDSYAGNNSRASNNGRAGYGTKREGVFEKTGDNLKPKDLVGIPWMVAFALRADGWWLRQDIIWSKLNPMPESVTDRCTKSHEYIFLLTKSAKYFYDAEVIKEKQALGSAERALYGWNGRTDDNSNGARTGAGIHKMVELGLSMGEAGLIPLDGLRNKRSVWEIPTQSFKEAHFATFPPDLIKPMVLAGCPEGGTILDPFAGSGTTGMVAESLGRNSVLIELNPKYIKMIERRTAQRNIFLEQETP